MIIKTNAFQDVECTCKCGNKHEYYGGKGYTTISNKALPEKFYIHIVKCNKCGELSEYKEYE